MHRVRRVEMYVLGWIIVAWPIGSFLYSHRFHTRNLQSAASKQGDPADPVARHLWERYAGRVGIIQGVKLAIAIVIAYNLLFGIWSR